eukprot:6477473-Amphidinium_carterae.2
MAFVIGFVCNTVDLLLAWSRAPVFHCHVLVRTNNLLTCACTQGVTQAPLSTANADNYSGLLIE